MKLTQFERTVLAHQCRQRQAMEPNNGDFWLHGAEAFERGYESEYREYMVDKDPVNEADLNEAHDILFMFRVLEHAKSKVKFAGFDGNDPQEVKLLGYVRHLWKQDSFKESDHGDNDGGNSHMEMLPVYRRMLEAYNRDPKNIRAIEDAQIHPRNRT